MVLSIHDGMSCSCPAFLYLDQSQDTSFLSQNVPADLGLQIRTPECTVHGQAGLDEAALLLEESTALCGPVDTGQRSRGAGGPQKTDEENGGLQCLRLRDFDSAWDTAARVFYQVLDSKGKGKKATVRPKSRGLHADNLSVDSLSTDQPSTGYQSWRLSPGEEAGETC